MWVYKKNKIRLYKILKRENLTSSLVCDMSEESCNLALISIGRTIVAEPRIRIQGTKKRCTGVEILPSTTRSSLINYPIEKCLCHNIRNRATT